MPTLYGSSKRDSVYFYDNFVCHERTYLFMAAQFFSGQQKYETIND